MSSSSKSSHLLMCISAPPLETHLEPRTKNHGGVRGPEGVIDYLRIERQGSTRCKRDVVERLTFGVGYYYSHVNPDRLTGVGVIDDHAQGFEAFYNIALTPSTSLTFDAQVVEDAFPGTDTAVILGARLHMRF